MIAESRDDRIVTDAGGQQWTWRPSLGPCCDDCGRPPGCGHTVSCASHPTDKPLT